MGFALLVVSLLEPETLRRKRDECRPPRSVCTNYSKILNAVAYFHRTSVAEDVREFADRERDFDGWPGAVGHKLNR
jgi:hypothetical protein